MCAHIIIKYCHKSSLFLKSVIRVNAKLGSLLNILNVATVVFYFSDNSK